MKIDAGHDRELISGRCPEAQRHRWILKDLTRRNSLPGADLAAAKSRDVGVWIRQIRQLVTGLGIDRLNATSVRSWNIVVGGLILTGKLLLLLLVMLRWLSSFREQAESLGNIGGLEERLRDQRQPGS